MPNPAQVQDDQRESLETSSYFAHVQARHRSAYQIHRFESKTSNHTRQIVALKNGSEDLRQVHQDDAAAKLWRLAEKLEDCCRTPWIMINDDTAEIALKEYRCKSRVCSLCGGIRATELREKLLPMVKEMDSPRFITLTPLSNDKPLREQLQHLTKCFAKLRTLKAWKSRFSKGFYTIEITYNKKTEQWHPHIHTVVDGKFIPHTMLSNIWHKITGDSMVVDIRMCHSQKKTVYYVTKYATKTQDSSCIPDHRLGEWALSVKSLRFINTYGGLRKPPEEKDDRSPFEGFTELTPMNVIENAIRFGDKNARDLFDAILYHASRGTKDDGTDKGNREKAQRIKLITKLRILTDPDPPPDPEQPTIAAKTPALFDNSSRPGVF